MVSIILQLRLTKNCLKFDSCLQICACNFSAGSDWIDGIGLWNEWSNWVYCNASIWNRRYDLKISFFHTQKQVKYFWIFDQSCQYKYFYWLTLLVCLLTTSRPHCDEMGTHQRYLKIAHSCYLWSVNIFLFNHFFLFLFY